jgi:hypothetical protein
MIGSGVVGRLGQWSLWIFVVGGQPARVPIFTRLWARMPCPVQVRVPSVPSRRLRSHPYPRLRLLIRPSQPVEVPRSTQDLCRRATEGHHDLRDATSQGLPTACHLRGWSCENRVTKIRPYPGRRTLSHVRTQQRTTGHNENKKQVIGGRPYDRRRAARHATEVGFSGFCDLSQQRKPVPIPST